MLKRSHSFFALVQCVAGAACASIPNLAEPDGGGHGAGGDGGSSPCMNAVVSVSPAVDSERARAPRGTHLRAGDDLSVRGVTSDGHVVYSDDAARHLYAMPLSGGRAQDLGALGSKFWVAVTGDVVFAWADVSEAGVGALSVWSPASGRHSVAPAAYGLLATASSDASRILFVDHLDAEGKTGDVSIASVDGSSAKTLVRHAYVAGCYPQLELTASFAVASHCDSAPTGKPSAKISSFELPALTAHVLATDAENVLSIDAAGTKLLASTSKGVRVVPLGGGAPTTIDPTGFLGQLSADGTTAYYSTTVHAFRKSKVTAPAPVTIVPRDFGGLYTLSMSEGWALYYWVMGAHGSDLDLVSTAASGASIKLAGGGAGLIGDGFTADSSHAIYVTNIDPCGGGGNLNALAVGETQPRTLGHGAWLARAAGGAKVVFNTGFVASSGLRYGRADIEQVDTSSNTSPTRVVSQADAVFELSPAKDELVYAWSARSGSEAGLYVERLR